MTFASELLVAHLAPDWRRWRLLSPLTFSADDGDITVPAGFVFDGASVPRVLWAIFSPTGRWMRAACIHDYGYALLGEDEPHPLMPDKRAADLRFWQAMRADHTNPTTAWLLWAAVRLFGRP